MYFLGKLSKFNVVSVLISLLVSVAIGFSVALNPKLTLLGIISVIGLFFVLAKWEIAFGVGLIGLFVIPYGQYDFFNLKIPGVKIDVFTALFLVISFVIIIKSLAAKQTRSTPLGVMFYVFMGMIIIYTMIGISNQSSFLLQEIKVYLLYVIYFLSICLFNKIKDGFNSLIKILLVSSFLLSNLVILMFFFKNTFFYQIYEDSFYAEGTRVAVSNLTIFMIVIPLLVVALSFKSLNKFWNILIVLTIPLMIISAWMEGSRTLISGIAFNTTLTLLIIPFLAGRRYAKNTIKVLSMFIIIGLIALISLSFGALGDKLFETFGRFNELFQTGTAGSYQVRQVTNNYTLELIKQNMIGYGIGSSMWLFNSSGVPVKEGLFIDNGFLTVLFKFGIPGLLVFIIFYVKNFFNIFKIYLENRKTAQGKAAFVILMCLPMFLFTTMYMSAQLVTNGVIFGFMLLIFGFFNTYASTKEGSM